MSGYKLITFSSVPVGSPRKGDFGFFATPINRAFSALTNFRFNVFFLFFLRFLLYDGLKAYHKPGSDLQRNGDPSIEHRANHAVYVKDKI